MGKTDGEQGLRPGLRLGVAASEVRQGARQGQRPPGVLRPGDQPDDLQPRAASTCSCTTSTTRSSTSPTATRSLEPAHWDDEPFEAIVSNPPYSINWEGDANPLLINDPRFSPAGVLAPKSKADLAFTMHMLQLACGQRHRRDSPVPRRAYRGGAEQKIRKYLIDNNYVEPSFNFHRTCFSAPRSPPASSYSRNRRRTTQVLFIDASEEYVRPATRTSSPKQSAEDPRAFTAREDVDHFAKLVPNADIAENGYNIVGLVLRRARGHTRGSRHHGAERRDRRDRRSAAELRAEIDAIVADSLRAPRERPQRLITNCARMALRLWRSAEVATRIMSSRLQGFIFVAFNRLSTARIRVRFSLLARPSILGYTIREGRDLTRASSGGTGLLHLR